MKRCFEFVEGKSRKFWEVWVDGCDLTTHWGRIGANGQTKSKTFATPEKAQAEHDKLVAEKLAKGYQEKGQKESPPPKRVESVGPVEPVQPVEPAAEAEPVRQAPGDDSAETDEDGPEGLRELLGALDTDVRESLTAEQASTGVPSQIHLDPADDDVLLGSDRASALSDQLLQAGFAVTGDFVIRELPVTLRGFLRAPNVAAVVCRLEPLEWIDLTVFNADGTREAWSSVPEHDGKVPPWSTLQVVPYRTDVTTLLDLMAAGRSGKEPAQLTVDQFPRLYEESYAREMQWRAAPPAPPPPSDTPEIDAMVWAFAREYKRSPGFHERPAPESEPTGAALMRLDPFKLVQVLRACYRLAEPIIAETRYDTVDALRERLLRRDLPYADADIEFLAAQLERCAKDPIGGGIDKMILGAIERHALHRGALSENARRLLRRARDGVVESYFAGGQSPLKSRIDALVGDSDVRIPIHAHEPWADAAIAELQAMPAGQRAAWVRLLQHCVNATAAKPSAAWSKAARPLVEAVTREQLVACVGRWLALFDKPRPAPDRGHRYRMLDPLAISESNQDILRGLVWCLTLCEDCRVARILGAAGVSAFRKIPEVGARAVRVGNACVFALGAMGTWESVAQLALLKVKVKVGTAQRFIEKELNSAAERLNVPRDELEEMSVPAYGLEIGGVRRESLGDFTAELVVRGPGDTELRWLKADGKPQKSVPAAVQKEYAEELKELKAAVKDIHKMLAVQRERLDGLFIQERSWSLGAWRERYFDHPLVGLIAQRLIWLFQTGKQAASGICLDGQLVGRDDRPLSGMDDSTTVTLWHPIGRPVDEVLAWRDWLQRHEIQQPFKQAHREVYLLTDAEEHTATYSNRFAAHVLRQTQYRALAQTRGWTVNFLGPWDAGDEGVAKRTLNRWDLRAEFWVIGAGEAADDSYGFTYVTTDQVRFYRPATASDPLSLAHVPSLVFSEILRDVDLFVGVASVGNDPDWSDGGPDGTHRDYWREYSFGGLSATAETRRDVLQRLLPRLKIADRCSLSDRFLEVRGDLRTYKIHLGSGNILMSPNDQYLCIVADRSMAAPPSAKVFLPFEGDNTLSVILSKAFLLAEDTKIKDPTITRQIKSGGTIQ